MATIQFSIFNRSDDATLSGGSWQPSLPLTNLQQEDLGLVARSVDALATSTRIDVDFGSATILVRLIGLMKHNLSTTATYQITAGTAAGLSDVYDSGVLDVWPRVYSYADLPFEDPNWWLGTITEEEASVYPIKLLHDAGSTFARYWRIQINDTSNADGYVEVARLWMGPVWTPSENYEYGAKLSWKSRDRAIETRSGKRYSERNDPQRVFSCRFGALMDVEAFGGLLDMQRRLGSEGQVVVIPDPDDTAQRHRRDLLARISKGDGVVQAFYGYQNAVVEFEEIL